MKITAVRASCRFALLILLASPFAWTQAAGKRPITFEDLMAVQRIADPQLSPDGAWIAYQQTQVDLPNNKKVAHIWLVPTGGGQPRQLTSGSGSDSHARWSPDSKSIAFISARDGKSQVWVAALDGGKERQVTNLSTEADGVMWAAHADRLLFTSAVYPDCPDYACNRKRLNDAENSKVKARVLDQLLYRHWDQWRDGRYTHLLVVSAQGGEARDLTPGAFDSPTFFLGAPDGYAISPDGNEVCYTSNRTGHPAWTTNNDLYLVSADGGAAKDITANNPGSDAAPQYSPDGRYIAYTSQARNGYESDRFRLRVYERQSGTTVDLTTAFDQWVESFAWAPDSKTIYFVAPDHATHPVFRVSVADGVRVNSNGAITTRGAAPVRVLEGTIEDLQVARDGNSLVASRSSVTQPTEIYHVALQGGNLPISRAQWNAVGGPITQLTHANDDLVAKLDMQPAESVTVRGALGASIQSLLVKPPAFDAHRKYPGLVLIHGGPQGDWSDIWGYRWNPELFASHGYVVIMTNFHGSTGYGQRFVEEISGDWGGAPYQDVMAGANQLAALPYVDSSRIGAAGASFGGYMIDWVAGHTRRFKALVSHDGVYDLRSMYGETEELWFPEWEFKRLPWQKRTGASPYDKWSPSNFTQNIQTPMLVVQGEQDFRVPVGQGMQLFTALQRRGIPSKLLYFPDEGHWVLKPQNSQLWYKTVLGWLDQYVQPGGTSTGR